MCEEELFPIKGYEGKYAITKSGKVWSYYLKIFVKHRNNRTGYYQVGLSLKSQRKFIYVHRLVAQTFIPNPENKTDVNHKDLDRSNNNLDNLEWATRSENIQHSERYYRVNKQIKRNRSNRKLFIEDVITINEKIKQGLKLKEIGDMFNVDSSLISQIKRGKIWKDVA